MSRKIREQGLKQLAGLAARQIQPARRLYDAKDAYEGTHKLVTGKKPPSLKKLLQDAAGRMERRP